MHNTVLSSALALGGPPPLTWLRVLTSWRAQPGMLAMVVVLIGGYALGVRRQRVEGQPWPWSRTACFVAGMALIALVELSFLGVYDDVLFWPRAVQNVMLLMVVPMLLALGMPITLIRDLMPARWRARLSRVLHSQPARALTFPLVVTVLLVVPLPLLYFSPLYELTLRDPVASGLSGLVVTLTGFGYFWSRFRLDPTPRQDSYGVTLVITIVEMIGDAVLGVVLWLGPLVAAAYYSGLARDWGPSLRTDQVIGAGVLWIGGDVIALPFIAVIFSRMAREDERHAARIDADLDAAALPSAPVRSESAGEAPRLWWEDDPQLSQRFRRR
ncbi:MAG: cytochrome c oxidase assembly protein [Pseudonocardia sp.]|nr:cytochrome c oxidase assembly protein [Pseudonocardia sp.]